MTTKNLISSLAKTIVTAVAVPFAVVLTIILWVWVPVGYVAKALWAVHQRVSAWTADQLVVWANYIEE